MAESNESNYEFVDPTEEENSVFQTAIQACYMVVMQREAKRLNLSLEDRERYSNYPPELQKTLIEVLRDLKFPTYIMPLESPDLRPQEFLKALQEKQWTEEQINLTCVLLSNPDMFTFLYDSTLYMLDFQKLSFKKKKLLDEKEPEPEPEPERQDKEETVPSQERMELELELDPELEDGEEKELPEEEDEEEEVGDADEEDLLAEYRREVDRLNPIPKPSKISRSTTLFEM